MRRRIGSQFDEATEQGVGPLDGLRPPLAERDVVDVLQHDQVGARTLQVTDERAMARRTDQQSPVCGAERSTVRRGGERVGGRLLGAERHVEPRTGGGTQRRLGGRATVLETLPVLGRDREMQLADAAARRVYGGRLGQLLLERRTYAVGIVVKGEQALRQRRVVQTRSAP